MAEATLFDEAQSPAAPLDLPLAHPYARYGLAVALMQSHIQPGELNEANLREALIYSIEIGLESFRMRTGDNPASTRSLNFTAIKMNDLLADSKLVQGELASKGIYLFPTSLTTDKIAQKTFDSAVNVVTKLRDGKAFDDREKFSRSFAPTTAKINNGTASQTEPKGSLLEVACALVTTLTPLKPAAWPGQNTVIIPDLPLAEMIEFVALFEQMATTKLDGDLMRVQLKEVKPVDESKPKRATKKPVKDAPPKSEYRRPRLHSGNYPFAPRDATFYGAVGLIAAIGRWSVECEESNWPKKAIKSLDDLKNRPLYLISYDNAKSDPERPRSVPRQAIQQVSFNHFIIELAKANQLDDIVFSLQAKVELYNLIGVDDSEENSKLFIKAHQNFDLQAARFLQQFNASSFSAFLGIRAEYPQNLQILFREYFMQVQKIDADIVASAQVYGQWLNTVAYIVSSKEVEEWAEGRTPAPKKEEIAARIRKVKAGILVGLESVAMSSKTPQEMLARVQSQVGRLLYHEAPAGAARFLNAVDTGELEPPNPQYLLMTYMRLRAPKAPTDAPQNATAGDDLENRMQD